MYLDLRALDITNVSDFALTFTQQEIVIFLITSMPQPTQLKSQDKLLKIKLQRTSTLLHLMQSSLRKTEHILEKVAIKEDVRALDFLPTVACTA